MTRVCVSCGKSLSRRPRESQSSFAARKSCGGGCSATARNTRHSEETKRVARVLSDGGWTPHQIQKLLAQQGVKVAYATVRGWVDDEYRQARLRATAADKLRWRDRSGEFAKKRMLELHAAGFSFRDISSLMRMYHGREITPEGVRHFVRLERERIELAEKVAA